MDANQQKISQLVSLAMDVLLDVAMTNLQSDEDLSFWLKLANKAGPDSSEPMDFLKKKFRILKKYIKSN